MIRKYVLDYSAETTSEPLLWHIVKTWDIKINILRAEISAGQEGNLLVEMEQEDEEVLEKAVVWLESRGVSCVSVSKRLSWDEEACIDCGSCTGVCFSGALSMDRVSWELVVDSERCTACGLCVPSCPMACFSLDFG